MVSGHERFASELSSFLFHVVGVGGLGEEEGGGGEGGGRVTWGAREGCEWGWELTRVGGVGLGGGVCWWWERWGPDWWVGQTS